jgi:hypothetical protein
VTGKDVCGHISRTIRDICSQCEQSCAHASSVLLQSTSARGKRPNRRHPSSDEKETVEAWNVDSTTPHKFKFILVLAFLRSVRQLLITASAVPSSPILVTLMNRALSSSETSVLTRATRRNIPEDTNFHSHRRENLKSYITSIRFYFLHIILFHVEAIF